jgi:hypothetical protein
MDAVKDKELQDLVDKKNQDEIQEACHSSCTNGYDNDGSTGYEIFQNGLEFGLSAASGGFGTKKGVEIFEFDIYDGDVTAFFIGTRDEVKTLIEGCSDEDEEEEEEDEDEEEN